MVFVNVSTTQWVTIVNFVNHCTMTFNGSQQLEKTKMNARVRCYFDHIQGGNMDNIISCKFLWYNNIFFSDK